MKKKRKRKEPYTVRFLASKLGEAHELLDEAKQWTKRYIDMSVHSEIINDAEQFITRVNKFQKVDGK